MHGATLTWNLINNVNSRAIGDEFGKHAMSRTAAIFGATGLIGRSCLEKLCGDPAYDRIVAIGRTAPAATHPKLTALLRPLDGIGSLDVEETGTVDDVFCCLGTTIAKARTTEAFQAVDRDAVIAACAFAARAGARNFLMVSAVGAWAKAPNRYNRTKGEAEEGVTAFADRLHVSIFRPSLLLGQRAEFRLKEKIGEPALWVLDPFLIGPLSRYRAVPGAMVAAAMIAAAKAGKTGAGTSVYEGNAIRKLAGTA